MSLPHTPRHEKSVKHQETRRRQVEQEIDRLGHIPICARYVLDVAASALQEEFHLQRIGGHAADKFLDFLTNNLKWTVRWDKVGKVLGLLDEHARHCMLGAGEGPKEPGEQADELMAAVGRLLHRG